MSVELEQRIKELEAENRQLKQQLAEQQARESDAAAAQISRTSTAPEREVEERKLVEAGLAGHAPELEEARSFLDSIIENIPSAIFIKEAESLRFVRVNKANEEGYKFKRDDLLGKNDYDLFPPEEAEAFITEDREILSSGKMSESFVESHYTAFEGPRLIHVKKVPILGSDGRPRYLLGIMEDITERRQAEQTILQQREFLSKIIETMPVGVFAKDVNQNYRYSIWNSRMETLFGTKKQDVLGKSDYDRFSKKEADHSRKIDQSIIETGEIVDIPAEIVTTEHNSILAHIIKVPIYDGEGNPETLLGIIEDITERKQAEETLAKRATELEVVAQVSMAAATILDREELLQTVADLTKERFGLYHVHIYLLEPGSDKLKLAAGAGEVGRRMVREEWHLDLNHKHSLVAKVARSQLGMIINDVGQARDFLANPLLPDTRSELAVPLMLGSQVLGVVDVQSDKLDHFSDEDLRIQTTLAGQVAIALQNSRLYAEAQLRAKREKILREVTAQVRGSTDPDVVLRTGLRALGSALGRTTFVRMGNMQELSAQPIEKKDREKV